MDENEGEIKIGEKGPYAALAVCGRCGEDTGELLLMGCGMKFECRECKTTTYGSTKCGKGGLKHKGTKLEMGYSDKVPYGLCGACSKQSEEHKEIVAAGGAYFRCEDCGAEGVIKKSIFTDAAREKHNIPAPAPIGIRLDKSLCVLCGEHPKTEQNTTPSEP